MTKQYNNRHILILFSFFFLIVFSATFSFAANITLNWNPPTENEDSSPLNDLDGYIIYYGTSSGTYTQNIDVSNATTYSLSGLEYDTTYFIALTAYDTSGNESTYSEERISFIGPATDITPPNITSVLASGITETSATISWTTDEAADTKVEYGTTTAYGSATTFNSSAVTNHSQSISGLFSSTLYHYRVLSRDDAGNLSTSSDYTFTSTEVPVFNYYCNNDNDGYFTSSVSGTCKGTGCVPEECQTTAGNDCNDNDPTVNPNNADDTCDGVDNNCDGTPDNNYVMKFISCGTGVCTSTGQIVCQSGMEVNTCTPDTPTENPETTCNDGLDNDCDGQVDDDCVPNIEVSSVLLSGDFSSGIPSAWLVRGAWNTGNESGHAIGLPFEGQYAIVDSSSTTTGIDELITSSINTASCNSVELAFSNQYFWYAGNIEVDVSSDGGTTWSNNIMIGEDDGYPSPNWKQLNISSVAEETDAKIRFKYSNGTSDGFWALDNLWVTCQSSQMQFTSQTEMPTSKTIMITNSGTIDLAVNTINISGQHASEFGMGGIDECSNHTLLPGETCTFDIVFKPASAGLKNANLSISSNDPDTPILNISLSGTGTDGADGACSNDPVCAFQDEICDDGIDNDGDNKVDCADKKDCNSDPACSGGGGDPEICYDGIDNDGDGKTDCSDRDCRNDAACDGGSGGDPEICYDGIDNDGDGKTDCADKKDCGKDPAC